MYYIDFDNTLYETGKLTKDVLSSFSQKISKTTGIETTKVLEDIKNSFNSTVDNFETFAKKLSEKYKINSNDLKLILEKIIVKNGSIYTFPDSINFLKKLKRNGEKVCILTFVSQEKNLHQQALKLAGSGILPYVTEVYNTTRYKFKLDINYKDNIFIDDSPRDLEGLYNVGSRKLIRIKKPNNEKRTSKKLNLPIEIPTFENFDDISLDLIK